MDFQDDKFICSLFNTCLHCNKIPICSRNFSNKSLIFLISTNILKFIILFTEIYIHPKKLNSDVCPFSLSKQTYLFGLVGVRLTARLRVAAFSSMLQQEMGWFDEEKNSVGTLCARLSGDAASVEGVSAVL